MRNVQEPYYNPSPKDVFRGVIIGAVLATAVVFLTNKDTRRKITKSVQDAWKEMQKRAEEAGEETKEKLEKATKKMEEKFPPEQP